MINIIRLVNSWRIVWFGKRSTLVDIDVVGSWSLKMSGMMARFAKVHAPPE
jgi:hypothetical protein